MLIITDSKISFSVLIVTGNHINNERLLMAINSSLCYVVTDQKPCLQVINDGKSPLAIIIRKYRNPFIIDDYGYFRFNNLQYCQLGKPSLPIDNNGY